MDDPFSIRFCGQTLKLQQQLLRGTIVRCGFERGKHAILRLVLLSGREIGLCEIEFGTGLVNRVRRNQRVVLADGAVVLFLGEEQVAKLAVQLDVVDRIDVIDPLQRCRSVRNVPCGSFELGQAHQHVRPLAACMFIRGEDRGFTLGVADRVIGICNQHVGIGIVNVLGIHRQHCGPLLDYSRVVLVLCDGNQGLELVMPLVKMSGLIAILFVDPRQELLIKLLRSQAEILLNDLWRWFELCIRVNHVEELVFTHFSPIKSQMLPAWK